MPSVHDTGCLVGSMCSGYGGLDLAASCVLGGRTVWLADNDERAAAVLAVRFPDTPNLGDLRAVDWTAVEPVDVLIAGFPCQPVSVAGRRAGIIDERWLFDDIADAVSRMVAQPQLLLLENVLGLLSANGGDAMGRVVHRLAQLGYVGSWRVVRASDVGACHQRARVFIAAYSMREGREGSDITRLGSERHYGVATHADSQPAGRLGRADVGPQEPNARRSKNNGYRPADGPATFGVYQPAVDRWAAVMGRPAPAPLDVDRRLNARFVEWMMGLPDGWVTDLLPRRAALHVLGNGVVPQQAAAAFRHLLRSHVETVVS